MITLNDSSNIVDLVQKYRNKQRLAGGYANPNTIGSIIQGGLEAMYNTQGAREDRAQNRDLANKNYELSLKDYALREENANRNYRLAKDQVASGNNAAILGMVGNMLPLSLATYKIGQDQGWWGGGNKTPNSNSGISLLDYANTPVSYPATESLSNMGFDFTTQSEPIFAGQEDTGLELNTGDSSWLSSTWDIIKNFLF